MIEFNEAVHSKWAALPFVMVSEAPGAEAARVNFWSVEASGNYAADCGTGRGYAAAMIAHLRETGDGPLLARVLGAMPHGDSGVEIGFAAGLAAGLMTRG